MSNVDRNRNRTFYTSNGRSEEQADELMAIMEPFFVITENQAYPLMRKEELETGGYAERFSTVIACTTQREVKKVIFVSRDNPPAQAAWVQPRHSGSVWSKLFFGLRKSFAADLDDLWKSSRNGLEKDVAERAWFSIGNIERAVLETAASRLGLSIGSTLRDNIRVSLYCLNACALAGHGDAFKKLRNLAQLLPEAIPIGELKHDPGTWIVLCA